MSAASRTDTSSRLSACLVLDEPVTRVKLVSPGRANALGKMGIHTVRDLLSKYPRRYIDLSSMGTIASSRIGDQCTIVAIVHDITLKRPKKNLVLVEITLVDDTGTLIVTAFRQPWLMDSIHAGMRIAIAGKLEYDYGFKRMTNPYIEVLDEGEQALGMIIPMHPACEKISAAWMRRLIMNALDLVEGVYDPLPLALRLRDGLMSRYAALRAIHFPRSMYEAAQARKRLAYEELLSLELMLKKTAQDRYRDVPAYEHVMDGPAITALRAQLPFTLTSGQERAIADCLEQMAEAHPANHLVLGDVGTGKTIVAAFAVAAAKDTGCQALFMAPTEILARQHGESLGSLFDACGISWGVITGSTDASTRTELCERFATGTLDLLIGTHALLEDDIRPAKCSLCIIDEQQRFGVEQRERFLLKSPGADALYLTATPIPRSLALALYGDMTLSYIKERPFKAPERKTVVYDWQHRGFAYDAVKEALMRGEQAYVICPLVQATHMPKKEDEQDEDVYEYASIAIESEDDYGVGDIAAATKHAKMLAGLFPEYNIGILHGKMSAAEKARAMEEFSTGETHVLVATTIVEVGVDVPNATVMVIENADRFGLSQLHQLRGRVGRAEKPGEVYLISSSTTEAAMKRLKAMESSNDGFELASYDLSLRREGDILGNRQHGASLLRFVNVVRDAELIECAHRDADRLLETGACSESSALWREVRMLFKDEQARYGG